MRGSAAASKPALSMSSPAGLGGRGAALVTLLTVRMLSRGFLAGGGFYPTLAHEPRHVDAYLAAAEPVFAELAEAIAKGDVADRIGGPVKSAGFARLT